MTEFTRIFTPRADKAVKAILLLTNGHRYEPTQEEKDRTLEVLKDAVNDIAGLYGMLPDAPKVVETADLIAASESRVEASRIDAKIESIKRSPFARGNVQANVAAIPEAQLTAYATHIMAQLCSRFEEAEAQPKNYTPKEE